MGVCDEGLPRVDRPGPSGLSAKRTDGAPSQHFAPEVRGPLTVCGVRRDDLYTTRDPYICPRRVSHHRFFVRLSAARRSATVPPTPDA